MLYFNIMWIVFCIYIIKMYMQNFKKDYFGDGKYFWPFNIGIFLFWFFMVGALLDLNGYIDFIMYFFPLWAIGPTLFFYGLRRLLILQMRETSDNKDILMKKFNVINDRINTMYVVCFLSVVLFIFCVLDGRLKLF